MKAEYQNEYGDWEPCLLLAHNLTGTKCMIELDGELGWCSAHLVEVEEDN